MKYVNYEIKNIEPIKLTSTIMQGDNEFTKSYISGANLRGAFIANYIKKNKLQDINKGEHKEKLLKGGIKFLNAYPIFNGNRTLPMPRCYYAEKEKIKNLSRTKTLDIVKLSKKINKEKIYNRIKGFEFMNWDMKSKELNPINLEKQGYLHIRKGVGNDNKLFRYEAIREGNLFKGSILCEDNNYAKEVKEVLENGLFYIGGSKGSGYGLCEFKNIKIEDSNEELKLIENEDFSFKKEITVIASSDIIFRNKEGIYKGEIEEEVIKEGLNLQEIKLKESFVETECFTGYNNKWGYRLPKILGIKAGSVFIYEIVGELDKKKIKDFVNEAIGERKADGFGRILITENLHFDKINLKNNRMEKKKIALNNGEKIQMELIVNRIYKEKLNSNLAHKVLQLNKNITGKDNIKNAQWGKLYRMMFLLEGLEKSEGVKKLENYFNNIKAKKINRDLAHSFQKIKIENKVLKDFILEELKNDNKEVFYKSYGQSLRIDSIVPNLTGDEIYKFKLKIFKELFRLQLKDNY